MALTPQEEQDFIKRNQAYAAPQNDFLASVSQMPQDQASKILRLATQANIDPMEAAKNPNATVQNLIGASDFEDVGKIAPKTYSFLSNPLHMAIVRDKRSVIALAGIEDSWVSWHDLKEGSKGVLRSAAGFGKGVVDFGMELRKNADATYAANHTPEEVEARKSEFGRQGLGGAAKATSDFLDTVANKHLAPDAPKQYANKAQEYTHAVVQQAPQIAAQIAIALATGGTSAMVFMGSQIAGSQYLDLRKDGVEPARAFGAAVVDAAAQAPLERVGLNKILKKLPANSPRSLKAREVIGSGLTEGVTEWIQQYPEALSEIWAKHPEYTSTQLSEHFIRDFAEITKEGAYQGLVAAPFGFLGGAVKVSVQKKTAEAYNEQREKIQAVLAKSPLIGQVPEVHEKHLNAITDGEKTYIDPNAILTLYQSSEMDSDDIDALLGVSQEEVSQAVTTGSMLEISTAKYDVASARHPEIHQALKEDISNDEDGLTLRRLKERNQQDISQNYKEAKQQRNEVQQASDDLLKQMTDAAIPPEVARNGLVLLQKKAYTSGENPAQWLREKAPLFRQGIAAAGAMHQYAGMSAYTADLSQLDTARELDKQGIAAEEIRQQAGWFKGMDGKWRFEVDDSQAKLIDLKGIKEMMTGEISGMLSKAKKMKDTTARAELEGKADLLMTELTSKQAEVLGNVLDHPALYQAYPWIRNITVRFGKMKEGSKGSYDPSINTIEINSSLLPEEQKKTLLHEVQHVIQEQENFARGGSPERIAEIKKAATDSLSQLREDVREAQRDYEDAVDLGYSDSTIAQLKDKLDNAKTDLAENERLANGGDPLEQYQSLAGEVEARDTASRTELTEEQRKEIAPDLRSDAIIYWGGREQAYYQNSASQVSVTGKELGEWSTPDELRKKTSEYYTKNLQGTSVIHPTLGKIQFSGSGKRKVITTSANIDKLHIVPKLPEIITAARYVGPEENTKADKRGNLKQYHWLVADIVLDGKPKRLGIKVFEDNNGNFYYNHNFVDGTKIEDPLVSRAQNPQGGPRVSAYNESSSIIITQPGELFQFEKSPKGSIHWNEEGRAIITMFENSDPSTLIHEMVGHFFVQNMIDQGGKGDAPDWMRKDRKTLLDFAGIENWEAATDTERREAHEKLARAAEAYILEGKAPSVETRSLFRKFAEWLLEVYQTATKLNVELSPEVRAVFDRMLATEEEIDQMRAVDGYLARMPANVYNKLSDSQKAELDRLLENTQERAESQVRAYLMLFLTADNKLKIVEEEKKVLERITEEVKNEPLYMAEAAIEESFKKKAKTIARAYIGNTPFIPEGMDKVMTPLDSLEAVYASMVKRGQGETQEAQSVKQQIEKLQKKQSKVKELEPMEQLEFEFIAELHGYSSGSELAQNLLSYNTSEKTVEIRLEMHMTAFKETVTDAEATHKEIQEAIYSDDGALLLAAEQEIIEELLGKVISRENSRKEIQRQREVVRQAAESEVTGMSLEKVMNLRVWISAVQRAAESSQKALAKGDLQTAREQKAIQLFNYQMVQESLKARREFDRIANFLKRQKKSGRDTWMSDEIAADGTRSTTDRHFIQGADLLRRVGSGRSDYVPEENRETLAHYAEQMVDENPDMVNLPEWLTKRPEDNINLRSIRIGQLKDIEGALRNIKKMAKEGRNMDKFSVLNGIGVEMTALNLINTAAPLTDVLVDKIEKEKVSSKDKFLAGLDRPDQHFLKLDGMQEDGPWSKAFYHALAVAQNAKSQLQRQVYEAIDAAYTAVGVDREQRQINAHRQIYIAEWDQSVRKNTLLAMLLNMGSKSNKERLLQSRPVGLDINHEANWNEPALRAVLTKYLEPRDFQLAQGIWDAINLVYEPYNAMIRKMTGSPLEKIEALPISFTMPDGTVIFLSGGYYPLKQDSRASMQAELNMEKSVMENFVGMMPYANAGASKSRVSGAKYSVDFDLDNLWRHITDVTHDIAFRPVMHDINKLLRHDGVRETLRQKLGQANYDVIVDWYRAIATAKDATVDNLLNQFMTFARTATTIKNLLFRPATLLQNLANFSLYGNAVRGFSERNAMEAYLKYGWGEYIPHAIGNTAKAKEIRAWVYEKSPMMRDKMESPDYTVRDIKETGFDNRLMDSSNEVLFKVGATISFTQEKVVEFGSKMLAGMDQLTDVPVFRGAYFQAITQGKSEQEAVRFAESVISRTTGSGRKIDTSLMQRGSPSEKVMTMFLTFLNTQYNRWAMEGRIFLSEKDYWRLIRFVGIKHLAFGMLSALFSGKLPDTEDEDGWLKWFFKEVVMWPMGMIPVGGPLAKCILDVAIGNKSFGYSMTPAEQNLEETIKLVSTVKRYFEGKAETPELLERGSSIASFFLRYPDQLNDWFWNGYDILANDMDPEMRDLMRRRPRKER